MPLITTKDGRTFTQVTVNVETGLKKKAKAAGLNFTQVFTEAISAKLKEPAV